MRIVLLVAAATLSCLLLSGTANAAAYPIRDRTLTAHKLYGTGALPQSRCPEPKIRPNDVAAAKRYLTAVLDCLDKSWAAHLKKAGLPFAKAKIGFITKPRKYCGSAWGHAAATYCPHERRFLVLLDKSLLRDTSDLFLFRLAAHEYAHHVQYLSGIGAAYERHPYRNKRELNEQSRRLELQAECLAGVYIRSVWSSLGERTEDDWDILLEIMRHSGDEQDKTRTHGKGRTIATWLDAGFRAGSPKACNTWTAPGSKVA